MKNIRVLLVDDHQVVRDGLRTMLRREKGIEIVGEGANGEEALARVEELSPDVVLMDIKMPGIDGIELTRQMKQKHASCNIILLTLYDEYLTRAMDAGAVGYLLKDIKREELTDAIRQVSRGEIVISRSITPKARSEYEERFGSKNTTGPGNLFEEVQLIMPPPVETNRLVRFIDRIEIELKARVIQMIGSWKEGTVLTLILAAAMPMDDIMNRLGGMPETKTIEDELVIRASPNLLEKAAALLDKASTLPRLGNKSRKVILITLKH
ncbi:MAG: response regulator transcription factor [Chloroflexota bacterium]